MDNGMDKSFVLHDKTVIGKISENSRVTKTFINSLKFNSAWMKNFYRILLCPNLYYVGYKNKSRLKLQLKSL